MKDFKHLMNLAIIGSALVMGTASADQQILDDLIVDGSACIGFDCVNGESFGFDTLRLKENNLRIRAFDTSTSASFPTRDWQITFNDTSNGGAEKFSIDDIDGGRTPFTITAGAPSHSLFVSSGGRLGIGTSTPVTNIHVKTGNTPTLRLEQDGSSGFTAQTWDVAGNEANFFIRDATSGSTLPFRIFPGAPSNALNIEGDTGDVGIGITEPSNPLHVKRTNATASVLVEEASGTTAQRDMLLLTNNGGPRMVFTDNSPAAAGAFWRNSVESNANQFVITRSGTGASEFILDNNGNLTLRGTLTTSGATCNVTPCDRVFDKEFYEIPSIEQHAADMWKNKHLPAVGPTSAEEPVNVSEKMLRMLNELEKAHVYIDQLNQKVGQLTKEKNEAIAAMELRLSNLENR